MSKTSRHSRIKANAVGGSTRHNIEVLLAEDVPNLGDRGEIVRVKPGYARNYLLPQGMATVATEHNKRMVEQHKQKIAAIEQGKMKSLQDLARKVSDYSVTIDANANNDGQLYGSIVAPDISAALKKAGYPVEPQHIKLDGPLKVTGMYTVKLQFHTDVKSEVKVWVVPSSSSPVKK